METNKLERWVKDFNKEIGSLQVSLDALFIPGKIESYYNLKIDRDHNNLLLEIVDEEQLPREIVDRILQIYLKSKPE